MEIQYPSELPDGVAEEHKLQDQETKNKCTKKKSRTVFTLMQITTLEQVFETTKYLNSSHRHHVAQQLELTDIQVKLWFQNRRKKFKKENENRPDCQNTVKKSTSLHSMAMPGQLGAMGINESLQDELSSYGPPNLLPPSHHQQVQQPLIPQQPMHFCEMQQKPSLHPYSSATQQPGGLKMMPHATSSGALVYSTGASNSYYNSSAYDYVS